LIVPVEVVREPDEIEAGIAGTPVDPELHPSVGCGIKWREDNEPR
jgi:hypothetical protein